MMTMETLVLTVDGFDYDAVEQLIDLECIRPAGAPGAWLFRDIDVARLRLIQDLRCTLGVQVEALPVVLHLLDQLYATRRRLLRLRSAIEETVPQHLQFDILEALSVTARPVAEGRPRPWSV